MKIAIIIEIAHLQLLPYSLAHLIVLFEGVPQFEEQTGTERSGAVSLAIKADPSLLDKYRNCGELLIREDAMKFALAESRSQSKLAG